jgi:hypothetical protein
MLHQTNKYPLSTFIFYLFIWILVFSFSIKNWAQTTTETPTPTPNPTSTPTPTPMPSSTPTPTPSPSPTPAQDSLRPHLTWRQKLHQSQNPPMEKKTTSKITSTEPIQERGQGKKSQAKSQCLEYAYFTIEGKMIPLCQKVSP